MDILITGAASGIGRGVALAFAAEARKRGERAPRMLIADLNREKLEETASQLVDSAEVLIEAADLAQPEACERLVKRAVSEFGGLDALISNAGVAIPGALKTLTLADYERSFAVNTRPTFLLGQAALPHLAERKGAIVATASIAAHAPQPALGAYTPSKAALAALVKQMALEWGPYGVRCNSVSPGPTLTGMTQYYADPEIRRARESAIPIRKLGMPEDIANVIVFLARPESGFVNGVDVAVDGGLLNTALIGAGFQAKL